MALNVPRCTYVHVRMYVLQCQSWSVHSCNLRPPSVMTSFTSWSCLPQKGNPEWRRAHSQFWTKHSPLKRRILDSEICIDINGQISAFHEPPNWSNWLPQGRGIIVTFSGQTGQVRTPPVTRGKVLEFIVWNFLPPPFFVHIHTNILYRHSVI